MLYRSDGVLLLCPTLTFLLACRLYAAGQAEMTVQSFGIREKPHIRALAVSNDSTAWFAGNRGMWGYTTDGSNSWHVDSISVDGIFPEFRSVAVLNDSMVLLLSVASPAYLFKTTDRGNTWKLVYKNTHKDVFFDCLMFSNKTGFAVGDPIDDCLQLIKTTDAGETWQETACPAIPPAADDEACFAASNSNLAIQKDHVWFVTGGKRARVFHSSDNGRRFSANESPLPSGEKMTGIFSCDFYDEKRGIIAGGHYERTDPAIASLAVSDDGGASWKTVKTSRPFFGSCVRFTDRDEAVVTGHDGTFTVNLETGLVEELKDAAGNPLKYHTLRFSPGLRYLWLAGSKGRMARIRMHTKNPKPE